MVAQIKWVQTYLFEVSPQLPEICFNCNGHGGFEYQYADNYDEHACECCNGTGFQQEEILVLWPEPEEVLVEQ